MSFDYRSCKTRIYFGRAIRAVRCYQEFTSEGYTMAYAEHENYSQLSRTDLTTIYPPDDLYRVGVGFAYAIPGLETYDADRGGYMGSNQPSEYIYVWSQFWDIVPDGSYIGFPLWISYYKDFKWPIYDWKIELRARPNNVETIDFNDGWGPREYNICDVPIWYVNHYPITDRLGPIIWGYTINCPFAIDKNNLPSLDFLNNAPPYPPIGPINPGDPPLPPCKCMSCCDSSDASLSLLRKMANTMGIDRYPVTLPRRMVQQGASGEVKLNDEIDRFEFLIRYVDRLLGLPPYQVEIVDSDPNKDGNQTVPARFESIGEMLKMLLTIELNQKTQSAGATGTTSVRDSNRTLFAMLNAALMEIGVIHKITAEIRAEMLEQTEFLGYDTSEIKREVDFAFSPLAKSLRLATTGSEEEILRTLPEMLKPSLVPIRYESNIDKKTLYQIVSDIRQQLLFIRGSVTSPLKTKNDLRGILDSVEFGMNAAQLVLLRDIKKALGAMSQNEFKEYLAEIENRYKLGFSKNPEDKDKSYQEDISVSPEIKMQVEKPKLRNNNTSIV